MFSLQNKNALVTGGAMGIGFATAKRLLSEGANVILWDLNQDALQRAYTELSPLGNVLIYSCDVTDKQAVYNTANEVKEKTGGIDILINNAGFAVGGYFLEKEDEVWEKTIDVNFTSLIYTTRAFLPGMYERNAGHIVNISSASSTIGVSQLAVYAGTKWAVHGFTESLRFEALAQGKSGVRFSTIHPSYIRTGLFAGAELGFPAKYIAPLIKSHDVIAKAVVESALKRGRNSPKRPYTVHLNPRLRALLPDSWFQRLLVILGITQSMKNWKGHST